MALGARPVEPLVVLRVQGKHAPLTGAVAEL